MTVWAVTYGNYHPPEVVALYDNKTAAEIHAATGADDMPYEVHPMTVRSEYRP